MRTVICNTLQWRSEEWERCCR